MSKVILHADLDAFFATAEEIRHPEWADKPLLIGHDGRSGIVSTASYAARKYGCHSGQPTFQALKCCPNAIVVPPDFDYYEVMSNSFFAILSEYSQTIEKASIDECYMDMSEATKGIKDPEAFFRGIQKRVKNELGLSVSFGVAPTKWLAKMASDMQKPMGLTFLRKKDIPTKLYPRPIESFWGIGRKTAPRLREAGISTIGDLAKRLEDKDWGKETFGKFYFELKPWIDGTSSDVIDTSTWVPKSIGASRTLMHDSVDEGDIFPMFRKLSEEVARRLSKERKYGKSIQIVVKDTDFKSHVKSMVVNEGLYEAKTIYSKAISLYRSAFTDMVIRLVGITVSGLYDPRKESVQMSLWNYEEFEKKDETKLLIGKLNKKFDKDVFLRASEVKEGKE